MRHFLAACFSMVVIAATGSQTFAQTIPGDVLNPSQDNIPARIPDLLLPEVQFIFDSVLDPDRVSLVQSVMEGDVNNPRLTEAARSIIRNHIIAMQQVELSIRFLQSNREDILSGNNLQFNTVFGNIGEDRNVAVVDPDILTTARVSTPQAGATMIPSGLFSQVNGVVVQIQIGQTGGGGGGGGANNNANANAAGVISSRIQSGDFLYVGDPLGPQVDPDAFVVQVIDIMQPTTGGGGAGGGGGGGGNNQQPTVLAQIIGIRPMTTGGGGNNQSFDLYKIVRFDRRPDTVRYERVLQTFQGIKDALAGFDPDIPRFGQFPTDITYQRSFEDMTNVGWAPGIAQFSSLDATVDRELSRTGIASVRGADRLVRQAGFSNSDSHLHLDRLRDQGNGQATDYLNRPTTPLLWTEDNESPLLPFANLQVPGSTDENRAFFRDRHTIFGEPDNPFNQYIGRAFLEQSINHPGDFFSDAIEVDAGTLQSGIQQARRPQRGPLFDLDGSGAAGAGLGGAGTGDAESVFLPESGVATTEQIELDRWQMIIESFAEHSTDLTQFNVAAFGIKDIFGEFVPDDARAQTGSNYALFADLIGGGGLQSIDLTRIEPFGKRSQSGFFPIVPRN